MRIRKDAVDVWEIPVIRRLFIKTAMAEMESANEDEWLRQLKIDFIGEEGVDAGGPCREFFSLLFRNTPVFENGGFSLNSELLEKKTLHVCRQNVFLSYYKWTSRSKMH